MTPDINPHIISALAAAVVTVTGIIVILACVLCDNPGVKRVRR